MGRTATAVDWARLRRLADRQEQLLTRRQCLAAGMTDEAVQWRVASRRWVRLHEGVYLTARGRDGWLVDAHAALLGALSGAPAADAGLRLSSAGFLWGLAPRPRDVHLVVPETRQVSLGPRVHVRRSSRWVGILDDMAYPWRTTPTVTTLDLATEGSELDALSLVARAVQRGLTTPSMLLGEIVDRGGHRHSALLRSALDQVADGAESGLEVEFVRRVERPHGLPVSAAQTSTGHGGRHDREFEEWGCVVEIDGELNHGLWSDRVRDGRRDRRALARSRVVTRVFFSDVMVTPCRTAAELGAILRPLGWTGRPRVCRRRGCDADRGC